MSGIHSGVQMLIKHQSLYAECVHSVCHRLNLVLNDAAECCAKIKSFLKRRKRSTSTFIGFSAPNWAILKAFGIVEESCFKTCEHNKIRETR